MRSSRIISLVYDVFATAFVRYGLQFWLCVGAMLIASIMEVVGVASLLPLFGLLSEEATSANPITGWFEEFIALFGIPLNFYSISGVIMAITVVRFMTLYWSEARISWFSSEIMDDMRKQLIRGLARAKWGYFRIKSIPELSHSLSKEAFVSSRAYTQSLRLIAESIQVAGFLALTILVSPEIIFSIFAFSMLGYAFFRVFIKKSFAIGAKGIDVNRRLMYVFQDFLISLKSIKSMNADQHIIENISETSRQTSWNNYREGTISILSRALVEPVIALLLILTLGYLTMVERLPLPETIVAVVILQRLASRVNNLNGMLQGLSISVAAFEKIRNEIDQAQAAEEISDDGLELEFCVGIFLENVSLNFGDTPVLDRVSLQIPFRTCTALVGRSGSGKTTIADLICGLAEHQHGVVRIDSTPIEQVNLTHWRNSIGYVQQDTPLFNESLRENITLWDPTLDDSDVLRALKLAGAADFVLEMNQGLDTLAGEHGGRLSGGQRQRIAIARALARRPQLLILDEFTAALDEQTEADLIATVESLKSTVTILMITHRREPLRAADAVIELDQGRIVSTERRQFGTLSPEWSCLPPFGGFTIRRP